MKLENEVFELTKDLILYQDYTDLKFLEALENYNGLPFFVVLRENHSNIVAQISRSLQTNKWIVETINGGPRRFLFQQFKEMMEYIQTP